MPLRDTAVSGAEQTQDVGSVMNQVVSMLQALQTKVDDNGKKLAAVTKNVDEARKELAAVFKNNRQKTAAPAQQVTTHGHQASLMLVKCQEVRQEEQGAVAQDRAFMKKLQEAVKKLNQEHDWTAVKGVLEAELDDESVAYRQLKLLDSTCPLFYVVYNNRIDLLRLLINAGLDVHIRVPTYYTHYTVSGNGYCRLLHVAAQAGNLKLAELLVVHRANTNRADSWGNTPLMVAVKCRRLAMIQCLIKHNADVNSMNDKGYTALHFAVECALKDIVVYLVKAGADTTAVTSDCRAPIHFVNYGPIYEYLSKLPH